MNKRLEIVSRYSPGWTTRFTDEVISHTKAMNGTAGNLWTRIWTRIWQHESAAYGPLDLLEEDLVIALGRNLKTLGRTKDE